MSSRLPENNLMSCFHGNFKCPAVHFLVFDDRIYEHIVLFFLLKELLCVSWGNSGGDLKSEECVLAYFHLLQEGNLYLKFSMRRNVSNLQVHYVKSLLMKFAESNLFSLFFCFLKLFPRYLFFFHHSFNLHIFELSNKLVDGRFGIDWERVFNSQKFICRVLVSLRKVNMKEAIDDLELIVNMFERDHSP